MNQFRLVHIAKDGFDLMAGMAHDAARFICAVIDQAACDVLSLLIQQGNYRAALEFTTDRSCTDGQKTFAFLAQGAHRTGVKLDFATDLQMVGQPLLARIQRQRSGSEQGADAFALQQAWQYVRRYVLRAWRLAPW